MMRRRLFKGMDSFKKEFRRLRRAKSLLGVLLPVKNSQQALKKKSVQVPKGWYRARRKLTLLSRLSELNQKRLAARQSSSRSFEEPPRTTRMPGSPPFALADFDKSGFSRKGTKSLFFNICWAEINFRPTYIEKTSRWRRIASRASYTSQPNWSSAAPS